MRNFNDGGNEAALTWYAMATFLICVVCDMLAHALQRFHNESFFFSIGHYEWQDDE
jgi:hypothetical protein